MGIDIRLAEIFIFWQIIRQDIQINGLLYADRQTYLRCSKSHTFSIVHRFKHILNKFFQIRIVRAISSATFLNTG